MKVRVLLVVLLTLLNVVDALLTQTMISAGQPVSEGNPIVSSIIKNYGWSGMWCYKILTVLAVSIGLALVFKKAAWVRIMLYSCLIFAGCVVYMLGLMLYCR